MLSCTGKRSHRHTILHVSFSNSFGLASARPTPQGLSGEPLSLSGGSNDFSDKTNIIIGCKDFYDDFYSACCELMEMEDKASLMAENFVDEENNITGTTTNN